MIGDRIVPRMSRNSASPATAVVSRTRTITAQDRTDLHFPNGGLHEQKAANRPNREKYKYSYGAKDCGSCESKLTDQKEHERKNAEAAEQSEREPLDGRNDGGKRSAIQKPAPNAALQEW